MTPEQIERRREVAEIGRRLEPLRDPAVVEWFEQGERGHISLILSAVNDDMRREATANLRALRSLRGAIERVVAEGERAREQIAKQSEIEA